MFPAVATTKEEGVYPGRVTAAGDWPAGLFLPMNLEPAYAYPLLVFLHGRGQDERQWLDLMPDVSRRNHVALALRGPFAVRGRSGRDGFGWGGERCCDSQVEDTLLAGIEEVSQTVRIHPRRVFVVGVCEGATVALRLALRLTGMFSGVAAFHGRLPAETLSPALACRRIGGGPRVLLGHGRENRTVPFAAAKDNYRLLHSAGLAVTFRDYPADRELTADMLRDLNRWVMTGWGC